MSNNTTLLAGSKLEFSVDDGTSWKELLGLQELPEFREESEELENTTVRDTTRQYRDGMDSPTEQDITAFYLKDDADQLAFRTIAKSKGECLIKVTYSDGDELEFSAKLKNYGIPGGDAPTQKMWVCAIRRSTEISFTEAAA